jgi:hypothetical protein
LLYAVLIGVVVQNIRFVWNATTAAQIFALAVVLEDYLAFHLSSVIRPKNSVGIEATEDAPTIGTRSYRAAAFVLDIAILLCWYGATLALTADATPGYFAGLATFFACKTGWEALSYRIGWVGVFTRSHGLMMAVHGVLALSGIPLGPALGIAAGSWVLFTPWWWSRKSM